MLHFSIWRGKSHKRCHLRVTSLSPLYHSVTIFLFNKTNFISNPKLVYLKNTHRWKINVSYIPKRIISTNLFISIGKHLTSPYNYEWDKSASAYNHAWEKTSPQHLTMHEKIFSIKLFYLYSINIQLYIIKYNKSYVVLRLVFSYQPKFSSTNSRSTVRGIICWFQNVYIKGIFKVFMVFWKSLFNFEVIHSFF